MPRKRLIIYSLAAYPSRFLKKAQKRCEIDERFSSPSIKMTPIFSAIGSIVEIVILKLL